MVETRSQRQAYAQRPPYPQITSLSAPPSTPQSVFQSTSSLASLSSIATPSSGVPQSSPTMLAHPTPFASAPLPSPSGAQPVMNYFAAFPAPSKAPTSYPAPTAKMPSQYQPNVGGGQFVGQRGGRTGEAPETAPYLQDFNLVAEAAKRAQMACLTRDLGEIGL